MRNDVKKLRAQFGVVPRILLDVASMAHRLGFTRLGLQSLLLSATGYHLPKGQARSNWARRELSYAQRHYAARDAYAVLLIYLELEDDLDVPYWVVAKDEEYPEGEAVMIEELTQSVASLSAMNDDLSARLARLEADFNATKTKLEQRVAALEVRNRAAEEKLAKLESKQPSSPGQAIPGKRYDRNRRGRSTSRQRTKQGSTAAPTSEYCISAWVSPSSVL